MAEQSLNNNSSNGSGFGVTLAAGVNKVLHADMGIQSCMIWTALTDLYIQVDAPAKSTIASCLIPANMWTPLPYENLNQVNAISATGGDVQVMARTR